MRIKLFTMVKDEVDIVEDWLKYHGTIFGYNNLYIIDNMSEDGTFEKLQEYESKGITLYRKLDYKLKGVYMNELINDPGHGEYDFAYPLDIDEFIIYYDLEQNKLLPFRTKQYFNTLPMDRTVYKANYIMSLISTNTSDGYKRATTEGEYGIYVDYKDQAKSFFNKHTWKGEIDHGNHYKTDDYMPTKLCLVHYHCRSLDQMKKKVINNVKGLGYDTTNIDSLRENLDGFGHHHVEHMIAILENTFSINTYVDPAKIKELVNFSPLASFIKGL